MQNDDNDKGWKIVKKQKKICENSKKSRMINFSDAVFDCSGDESQPFISDSDEFHEDDFLYDVTEDEWQDKTLCICGPLVTKGHKYDCPQNPKHLYATSGLGNCQEKKQASLARGDCTNIKTMTEEVVVCEGLSVERVKDDDPFSPDGKQYCICLGKETKFMVQCDDCDEWFHFACVGLSEAPDTDTWYCDKCKVRPSDISSDSSSEVTVSGPLPSDEWKCAAMEFISKWGALEVCKGSDEIRKVRCAEIHPHIRNKVVGDGHCLFQAFSKEISGTEDNHAIFRKAIVNFITHKDVAEYFCRFHFSYSELRSKLCNPVKSMNDYVSEQNMNKNGWGTELEIYAFATMLQIHVCVFTTHGRKRAWVKINPF